MSGTAALLGHVSSTMTQTTPPIVRFGAFEADLTERKLYRDGQSVDIQSKAFGFLAALLTRAGETVSRKDIAAELWRGVYVQEDQGLNAAVRKVRMALNDSAYNPKYIQTVGSLGYRFIHPVEFVEEDMESTGTEN